MDNFLPLVSIVIPVYNGSNFLGEAINSALGQTYTNIEVIIINDGSTDDGKTRDIALSYGHKVRYIEKENGGVASALNVGIKEMHGRYFSWLSHDDVYNPEKIETQIGHLNALDKREETILYSDYCYINEQGNIIETPTFKHVEPNAFRTYFIMGGVINGCTLLIPRHCFDICGSFRENLRATQDYDLWFRFSEHYSFIHMPLVLVKSRQHANQDTVKLKKTVLDEGNTILLFFLKSISKKEIVSSYEKPLPIYYLDFATMNYYYFEAGLYSFFKAIVNFRHIRSGFIFEYFKKLYRVFALLCKVHLVRNYLKVA